MSNYVYFEKAKLTQPLTNRLIRLAAFQNSEYYRAQAMRMSVWDKPRVIGCAENFPHHIGLPHGCLDAAQQLLRIYSVRCDIHDQRLDGTPVDVTFAGTLQQYEGRLHREHAAKTDVRIIDFVDTSHPALLRMWDKRQRGYRAMGYRIAETLA